MRHICERHVAPRSPAVGHPEQHLLGCEDQPLPVLLPNAFISGPEVATFEEIRRQPQCPALAKDGLPNLGCYVRLLVRGGWHIESMR